MQNYANSIGSQAVLHTFDIQQPFFSALRPQGAELWGTEDQQYLATLCRKFDLCFFHFRNKGKLTVVNGIKWYQGLIFFSGILFVL